MKLAIYDFDGTYVSKQSLPILYQLWKNQKLNMKAYRKIWYDILFKYLLYKLKIFGWDKRKLNPYTMRKTADLFKSIPRPRLDQFLIDNYHHLQNYIFEPLRRQIEKDREEGHHIVLLSGNLDLILRPFKHDGFDTIIGTISERNHDILSSNEIHVIIEDKKKQMILDLFPDADFAQSKAYADNGYDLPILELVGNPCAVNPDSELKAHAIRNNWMIMT